MAESILLPDPEGKCWAEGLRWEREMLEPDCMWEGDFGGFFLALKRAGNERWRGGATWEAREMAEMQGARKDGGMESQEA